MLLLLRQSSKTSAYLLTTRIPKPRVRGWTKSSGISSLLIASSSSSDRGGYPCGGHVRANYFCVSCGYPPTCSARLLQLLQSRVGRPSRSVSPALLGFASPGHSPSGARTHLCLTASGLTFSSAAGPRAGPGSTSPPPSHF